VEFESHLYEYLVFRNEEYAGARARAFCWCVCKRALSLAKEPY